MGLNASADLESLHRKASGHYLRGELDEAMRVWRELLGQTPGDVRAREGVRLCEELARLPSAPASAPEAAPMPAPAEFVVELPPIGEFGSHESPPAEVGVAAAAELERRVQKLVADAGQSADGGDYTEALKIIERVLILDEENADALALRARLLDEPAPEASPSIEDVPLAPLLDLDLEAEGIDSEFVAVAPPPTPTPTPTIVPAAQAPDDEPAPKPAAVAPKSAKADKAPAEKPATVKPWTRALVLLGTGRTRLAALAGIAVVIAAVSLWALSGSKPRSRAPEPAARAEEAVTRPADSRPSPPVPAPRAAPVETLDTVVARATAAAEAKDWAAAVLAYDRATKLAPDDLELRKKLQVAAAAYKVQEQERERWDEAARAFDSGNYDAALRCFYRMPNAETDPRILESKTRGWFNLGVTALLGHDCPAAVSSFEEARAIHPADREVQAALALARDCGVANAATFPLEVAALKLRRLEN
jgi:tetratricopeptide (TPR) repeat protein